MKINAALAALCGIVFTAHAWDSSENNIWLEAGLKGKISDSFILKLSEQVRYKEDSFNYFYRHTDVCVQWNFAKGWYVSPAYRYVTATKKSKTESTPNGLLNVGNTTPLFGIDVKSKLRIFYTDLNGVKDRTDLRPKLTLIPSKGWTALKLKPYVEDELMFNLNDGRLYLNRLTAGLKCTPFKKLTLSAFIMQDKVENTRKTNWNERYNCGMSACLNF